MQSKKRSAILRTNVMVMSLRFKKYKATFRYYLKPVFAMLAARRKELQGPEWVAMVQQVRLSVVRNPSEFLGQDLPEQNLLNDILEEIFHDFMKECVYHDSTSAQRSKAW
jgi:hypothetical protein